MTQPTVIYVTVPPDFTILWICVGLIIGSLVWLVIGPR